MQVMTCPDTVCTPGSEDDFAACEISEILQQQLRRCPHADLRNVQVEVDEGVIRLHGRVPSFHAKQLAHIVVRDEYDACYVENAIIVA
jgi:hypothetical protein